MKRILIYLCVVAAVALYADTRHMAGVKINTDEIKALVSMESNRILVSVQNLTDHPLFIDLQTSYMQILQSSWASSLTDNFTGRQAPSSSILPPGTTNLILYAISSITETDAKENEVHFKWPPAKATPAKINLQIYGPDGVRKDYTFEGELSKKRPKI